MSMFQKSCNALGALFVPPQAITPLPAEKVPAEYRRQRIRNFTGIFSGYGASYLVRSSLLSLAIPVMLDAGIGDKASLGMMLSAFSIAYGVSKFVMGNVSDRSNPRYFLAFGLLISALATLVFGCCGSSMYTGKAAWVLAAIMFICGWGGGMCYPPCVRILAHWFSIKERSLVMAAWNVSHNAGGCLVPVVASLSMTLFGVWRWMFFLPAIIVMGFVALCIATVRDTPQSVGLPSIEDYHQQKNGQEIAKTETEATVKVSAGAEEKELSGKEIFFKHILNNRAIWFLSFANVFVYFVRFGVLNWIPTYLHETRGFSFGSRGLAMCLFELAGIPAMMISGYISEKFFQNRRTPVIVISMLLTIFAVMVYWRNPVGSYALDLVSLSAIGFLIYGPVVFIGMQAVDVVYKKAVGTATGMTGFFGYIFGSAGAGYLMGAVVQNYGWDAGFIMIIVATVLAVLCLIPVWNAGGEK